MGTCVQALTPFTVADSQNTTAAERVASACYLACRVLANDSAHLCLTTGTASSDACIAAASAELEQCAAECTWQPAEQVIETAPAEAHVPDSQPVEEDAPLGVHRGYLCDSTPFIVTSDIRRSDALSNCELLAATNPGLGIMCTWNEELIFDNCEPRSHTDTNASVCGLFRGGVSEGEHMIASPNLGSMYVATDEDCVQYCRESGALPGDLCMHDGVVVASYEDAMK
jgi:hypothetical protein